LGMDDVSLAAASPAGMDGRRSDAASAACFSRPVRADIFQHGRKIAGAAQRRTRQGLLHQGSLQGANVRLDASGRQAVLTAVVAELVADPQATTWVCDALENSPIFQDTLELAENLDRAKYGSAAWLEKR
jgi:hypothetical protein